MCHVERLAWPKKAHPGDAVFVNRALRLTAKNRPAVVEFLFGDDIEVDGPYRTGRNTFKFPKNEGPMEIGLLYRIGPAAVPQSKIAVAVTVKELRLVYWKVAAVVGLGLIGLAPSVIGIFQKIGMGGLFFELKIGDAALFSLPAVAIISFVFSWNKISELVSRFYKSSYVAQVVACKGEVGSCIEICEAQTDTVVGIESWVTDPGE